MSQPTRKQQRILDFIQKRQHDPPSARLRRAALNQIGGVESDHERDNK